MINPGKYKHYKGKFYQVLFIGKHSETLEDLVVYKALHNAEELGNNAIWIRPLKMFSEEVEIQRDKVKRFEFIED